jgi:hypothetical protein
MKSIPTIALVGLLLFVPSVSSALIHSQVWYQVDADTLQYQVVVSATSPAPVNVLEIKFDLYHSVYNPSGRFLTAEPVGIPPGWFVTTDSNPIGKVIRWETISPAYAILPGEFLWGFSVVFTPAYPIDEDDLVQVYDVYEFTDKSGQSNKDFTIHGTPVAVERATWGSMKLQYR